GLTAPEREDRLEPRALQLPFSVDADIFEEEISKGHVGYATLSGLDDDTPHDLLIALVVAREGQAYPVERQPDGPRLRLQQALPDRVHGNPPKLEVDRGEEPNDLDPGVSEQQAQGPSAVLAAAPAHQNALLHRRRHGPGYRTSPRGAQPGRLAARGSRVLRVPSLASAGSPGTPAETRDELVHVGSCSTHA